MTKFSFCLSVRNTLVFHGKTSMQRRDGNNWIFGRKRDYFNMDFPQHSCTHPKTLSA